MSLCIQRSTIYTINRGIKDFDFLIRNTLWWIFETHNILKPLKTDQSIPKYSLYHKGPYIPVVYISFDETKFSGKIS